ncbi:DEAD/DEAH box helicase family protein [Candidatus Poseidoniaceae archaeon]|nr:DEAD/DEAH box helicase family protein [Candidatus Poseidoniaceae archaeon]
MTSGMNESETCDTYITPAVQDSGWKPGNRCIIRREFSITAGRIQGPGQRGSPLRADYVLVHRNKKLAIIEAKKWDLPLTEGVQQAKDYAQRMHVRFTYSSNGQGFWEIDMLTGEEKELTISEFPTPEELWERTYESEDEWRDKFSEVPFEDRGGTWTPRYYQDNAVEAALKSIGDGNDRILLTLATGTGKTSIAFQIAWKLFQTRWNRSEGVSRRPRILFLADRNILANQAYNSFSAFGEHAMERITPAGIRKKGRVPKNANIFFTIFQTFMSGPDDTAFFGEYPEDFFDMVIVDECHRGGANDESTWREILEYFSPAVQLGLTATPKRDDNVDTYAYFGEPVYTYSLKDGISDGFLTPFRVRKISTTIDNYVHTADDTVLQGEVEEGKEYTEKEFARRVIEIQARMKYRVERFMEFIDQSEKTIIFCPTQVHAAAVRDLINQLKTSTDPNYCVRVTANDGELGEKYLREFQDNERSIPTILTTSKKLSTGVDARNVRHIVLLRTIKSMIEFKQIIGRGTRLYDDKYYFTIHDFVNASEKFQDPEWDGEPVEPEPTEPREPRPSQPRPERPPRPEVIRIKLSDGKERSIQHMEQTLFYGPDGKPMSSSEFIQSIFGVTPSLFKDEEHLREIWSNPETRKKLMQQLTESGFTTEHIEQAKKLISAEHSDVYDVLSYIAYATPVSTREERALMAANMLIDEYEEDEKLFLKFVLGEYVDHGVEELDVGKLPELLQLKYGGMNEAVSVFGAPARINEMFVGFQKLLYAN